MTLEQIAAERDAALARVRDLEAALRHAARLGKALECVRELCAGDRNPRWADDQQTTHTRGVIVDICEGAALAKGQADG
jgi:hypothetical protein